MVLVDRDGTLAQASLGITDWESATPVTADHYFRIGSITKAFTGLTLLKAQARGCLQLSDPVAKHLPPGEQDQWFTNPWEDEAPLRLAHLLEHTAGWYDMSRAEFDHNVPLPLADALAIAPSSRRSHWPPGRHDEYSNSGAGLAAFTLEQACEVDFEDFMTEQVLKPLGMHSANLSLTPQIRERLVQGYNRDHRSPIPYWHILYRPAGGMNVVPSEMAGFLRLLINRGQLDGQRIFTEAEIQRAESPRTTLAAKSGLKYGYGLGNYHSLHKGHVLHGHGGDADGYLAHFAYSLESGRGYFVVITAFDSKVLNAMREPLDDFLIKGLPTPEPPPVADLPSETLQKLTGTYHRASIRFPRPGWQQDTLQVRYRNGQLSYRRRGRWRQLLPVNAQHFRRRGEPVATAAFIESKDGLLFQGPMGNWLRGKKR